MHGPALRFWTVAFLSLAALLARPCPAQIIVGPGQARVKIQEAIDAAVDGDVVLVKASTYKEVLDFKGKKIKVASESGAETTIIDATEVLTGTVKSSVVVFKTGENAQSILEGFTITKGTGFPLTSAAQLLGGGILIDKCTPVIRNCIIKSNTAHKGGGIFVSGIGSGGLIEGCEFSENKSLIASGGSGAGINVTFTGTGTEVLTLKDCRFIKNNAANAAGVIWGGGAYLGGINAKAKVILDGCTFEENLVGVASGQAVTSAGFGGGVFLDSILIEMRGGEVTNNRALSGGGIAVRLQGPNSIIQGTRIDGNESILAGGGGGLYFVNGNNSRLLISKAVISNNKCGTGGGGAAWIDGGGPNFDSCQFIDNSSIEEGGALRFYCTIKSKVSACLFKGNHSGAQGGGAIYGSSTADPVPAPVVYANCIFVKNSSVGPGGAVYNQAPAQGINKYFYCTFYGNSAGAGSVGGIHFNTGATASVINCLLWGNTPSDYPPTSAASISYSVLQVPGSLTPVRPGMLFVDPQFVAPDAETPDFHLKDTSPVLDKGTEGVDVDLKPPAIPGDFDGNPRFSDGPDDDQLPSPDMGALEFQSGPVVHPKFVRGLCRHPGADLSALSAADLNVADAIYLLRYKFGGLYPEPGCLKACDADDSGQINETDAIYILLYLFHGSNQPPKQPFPALDTDPTPDALSCVKGKIE